MTRPAPTEPGPRPLPTPTYPDLPVVAHREALLDAIRDHQVVIVAGETGSGKSTQLPKLCLELGLGARGRIGHTQPRRLAARAVAERVAEELGVEVGGLVGYSVRFNDHVSDATAVKVMTDGILLAEIQRDRLLRAYEAIIIDEAHERSLNIDFLLGYLRQILPRRPDLKVIVTSATIDTARFAAHFGGAPVVEVSGRSYPVEVRYRPVGQEAGDDRDQTTAICDAVVELTREGSGDVLVFLSGEREIRDTADALRRLDLPHTELLPLYARLSAAEQHRVFAPHRGQRVVLATNVAETSLTVPGITAVVDPGTARISRYNRRTKVQRLPIEDISQASANQRAGRCGRVAPGVCIRLYSEEDFASRPEFTEPEVLRTNLASVILQMAALGLGDVAQFPFVEPPDQRAITDGLLLLEELGAIRRGERRGSDVRLTGLGRRLARLPVDPRIGRMVLEADRHGCAAEVLVIAAALSIQDPRERPAGQEEAATQHHRRFVESDSDFLAHLSLWRYVRSQQRDLGSSAFRRMCRREHLHFLRIREWQDLHAQLRQIARGIGVEVRSLREEPDADAVHRSLLAGLLSQIGHWDDEAREYRGARESRFVLAGGAALGKRRPAWVMAAELVETNRLRARTVAPIRPEWLEDLGRHLVTRSYSEPWWDRQRAAAVTHERVTLFGLPIVTQRRIGVDRVDPELARQLFIRHALVEGDWDAPHAFLAENWDRVVEVLAAEHRVRRDLLVSQEQRAQLFDERIPHDVTSGRRFDRWWRDERARRPDLLSYRLEDLVDPDAGPIDDAAYPEWLQLGAVAVPVTYTDERGHDLDGVSVDVPVALLDQAESLRLDWQVPGYREELLAALVRTLPKDVRRHLGPVGEAARRVLAEVGPHDGPLLEVVVPVLARHAGVPVRMGRASLDQVPNHLRVTYRAVDDRGRALAWSKDLPALRRRMRARQREALAAAAPIEERTGLRTWPGGEVPRTLEVEYRGQRLVAHPALVDEGDSVALRVLPTEPEQRAAMWGGTRRLLLLAIGSPLRTIDRALTAPARLAIAASDRVTAAEVYTQSAEAAVDALLLAAGGPAWEHDAFERLVAQVKQGFARVAGAIASQVGEIVAVVDEVERRLDGMLSAALDETVLDVRAHLDRLLHPGWIAVTGADGLPDLRRYVDAIAHRVERAPKDPRRDERRLVALQDLERRYRMLADRDVDGSVRTLLEELRVATFAQSVGARGGPSEQKARKAIDGSSGGADGAPGVPPRRTGLRSGRAPFGRARRPSPPVAPGSAPRPQGPLGGPPSPVIRPARREWSRARLAQRPEEGWGTAGRTTTGPAPRSVAASARASAVTASVTSSRRVRWTVRRP
ncbi:MAG: ATP-dependent RNA helicase HrpA [Acidimicrobiia bacterium]